MKLSRWSYNNAYVALPSSCSSLHGVMVISIDGQRVDEPCVRSAGIAEGKVDGLGRE